MSGNKLVRFPRSTPNGPRGEPRDRPAAKRRPRKFLLLRLLGLAAFGVTFALVRRGGSAAPSNVPPGVVWVPGGEFTTGSEGGAPANERRAHRVRVDGLLPPGDRKNVR